MSRLLQIWYDLRASFWFLPAIFIFGFILLAVGLLAVDHHLDPEATRWLAPILISNPASARALLSAIATAMATVAGVVFSTTLVAISLASSQYTPRVMRNFMRDRLNQSVFGVFAGIFVYCLLVIRAIGSSDAPNATPPVALLGGLVLGLTGVAFLVIFIHHISVSVQAVHILAAVHAEVLPAIDRLYPEQLSGDEDDPSGPSPGGPDGPWHPLASPATGYLQLLDRDGLIEFARREQTAFRMERRVGDFLIEGTPLVATLGRPLAPKAGRDLQRMATVGRQRTVEEDIGYGIRQLVDVAIKALSPSLNDTTTAVMAVDYLTAILARLLDRSLPTRLRDADGDVRLVLAGPTFAELLDEALDQIRENAAGNVAVISRLLAALGRLETLSRDAPRRALLLEHARAVEELARRSVPVPKDRLPLEHRAQALLARLTDGVVPVTRHAEDHPARR